jgi:hypothetical protein
MSEQDDLKNYENQERQNTAEGRRGRIKCSSSDVIKTQPPYSFVRVVKGYPATEERII